MLIGELDVRISCQSLNVPRHFSETYMWTVILNCIFNVVLSETCPVEYTGKYDPEDQTCPCGKFAPGMCKSGLVIPLWMGDDLDHYVNRWAISYATNKSYAWSSPKNRLTGDECLPQDKKLCKDMYFLADLAADAPLEVKVEGKCYIYLLPINLSGDLKEDDQK